MHRFPFFVIAQSCSGIGSPCVVHCPGNSCPGRSMSDVDRPATVGDSDSVWGNQATLIRDYIDCSAGRLLSDNRSGQLSAVWPGPNAVYYIILLLGET